MTNFKTLMLILFIAIATNNVFGQANPSIAVLPANSGIVAVGATLDLEITIGNTGTADIPLSKLRPVVTVPAIVTFLADAQQTGLPAGWTIVSNTGAQLRFCNSGEIISGSTNRTIILKVQGVTTGGPTTFSGQLNYGGTSCTTNGAAPSGNVTADDNATSTITVVSAPLPLTLLSFSAILNNCEPVLKWITESEINTDRFEIERSIENGNDWKTIGDVVAKGSANLKNTYNFTDKSFDVTAVKNLYRLKMIDKDGKFKYSSMLPVNINCKNTSMSVYPNPVMDGKLYINITGFKVNPNASLLSSSGQKLMQTKVNNGSNFLNVSTLPAGIYVLIVTDDNGAIKREKVTIQR